MSETIAAFDFDGTISRSDTLVSFLRSSRGNRSLLAGLFHSMRTCFADGARPNRDVVKSHLLAFLLAGLSDVDFDELALAHARRIRRLVRSDALEQIRWHRSQGHRVVIVSASLAAYLRHLAPTIGVDEVIAVEMKSVDGHLTGEMRGPNVRGPEKAVQLQSWLNSHGLTGATIWAYGDSAGDLDLLDMAHHRVPVKGAALPENARRPGQPSETAGRVVAFPQNVGAG